VTLKSSYGTVELEIAFLIGRTPEDIDREGTHGSDCYGWRAAQIASWSVPIACCIKCRRDERACGGLTCRHTTHRECWPEAFGDGAECHCAPPRPPSPQHHDPTP
jgi:hypothetical protein